MLEQRCDMILFYFKCFGRKLLIERIAFTSSSCTKHVYVLQVINSSAGELHHFQRWLVFVNSAPCTFSLLFHQRALFRNFWSAFSSHDEVLTDRWDQFRQRCWHKASVNLVHNLENWKKISQLGDEVMSDFLNIVRNPTSYWRSESNSAKITNDLIGDIFIRLIMK